MTGKNKSIGMMTIINLIMVIPTLFSLFRRVLSLIEWEAQKAGRSLVVILVLYLLTGCLLLSTWLCILAIFFLYLIACNLSWMAALFIILGLNIFLILITGLMIMKHKKDLSFPETRQLVRTFTHLDD